MPSKEVQKDEKKTRKKRRKPLPPLTHSLRDAGLGIPELPRNRVQKPVVSSDNSSERDSGPVSSPHEENPNMFTPTNDPQVQEVDKDNGGPQAPARSVEEVLVDQASQLLGQLGSIVNSPPPPKKFDRVGVLEFGAKVGTVTLIAGGATIGVAAALKAILGSKAAPVTD